MKTFCIDLDVLNPEAQVNYLRIMERMEWTYETRDDDLTYITVPEQDKSLYEMIEYGLF
jgi:hypothetical protein